MKAKRIFLGLTITFFLTFSYSFFSANAVDTGVATKALKKVEIAGSGGIGFCSSNTSSEITYHYCSECECIKMDYESHTVCDGAFGLCAAGYTILLQNCDGSVEEYTDSYIGTCFFD